MKKILLALSTFTVMAMGGDFEDYYEVDNSFACSWCWYIIRVYEPSETNI